MWLWADRLRLRFLNRVHDLASDMGLDSHSDLQVLVAYGLAQRPHPPCQIVFQDRGTTAFEVWRHRLTIVPKALAPAERPWVVLREAAHSGQPEWFQYSVILLGYAAYPLFLVLALHGLTWWPTWTLEAVCGVLLVGGRTWLEHEADCRSAEWWSRYTGRALPSGQIRARLWMHLWNAVWITWWAPMLLGWVAAWFWLVLH